MINNSLKVACISLLVAFIIAYSEGFVIVRVTLNRNLTNINLKTESVLPKNIKMTEKKFNDNQKYALEKINKLSIR